MVHVFVWNADTIALALLPVAILAFLLTLLVFRVIDSIRNGLRRFRRWRATRGS
jgi:hypothetical protein